MTLEIDLIRALREPEYRYEISVPLEYDMTESVMLQAADEIEKLCYVLEGVKSAIKTGRHEPLMIWRDQIDIALKK